MIYAQVKDSVIKSIVVFDDVALEPVFAAGFDALVRVDNVAPFPQVGWLFDPTPVTGVRFYPGPAPSAVGGGALPVGGTTGQVLAKLSATNGDADWITPTATDILTAEVTLSNAQVLTLFSSPVVLVPAPGIGFTVILKAVYATSQFVSMAYTVGSGNTLIKTAGGITLANFDTAGGALLSQTGTLAKSIQAASTQRVHVENEPIVIQQASEPTGDPSSDTIIKFKAWYQKLPYPLT